MGKKHLSLVIVPHTKTSYRTLSFSKRVVKGAIWGSIAAGVLLLGMTVDYVILKVHQHNFNSLVSENAKQKETITQYEGSIKLLKTRLEYFDSLAKKLNIIAGIKSPEEIKEVGIGGPYLNPDGSQAIPGPTTIPSPGAAQDLRFKAEDIQKKIESLVNFFQDKEAQLASTPSIYPTRGLLTSAFQWRNDPFTGLRTFHYGYDIAAAVGNPIVATADGVVIQAVERNLTLGNYVIISHGLGVTTKYGHMSRIRAHVGQQVRRGDIIGEVGATGKAVGPHVHYEVSVQGSPVNPYYYVLEE